MSQIKVYAHRKTIDQFRDQLSQAIHQALVESLSYPAEKKFQLEQDDFIYPDDRSDSYIIIEISMFEGRSIETKKRFVQAIFANIQQQCGISAQDIEITIFETPKCNWGIRGKNADELGLNYQVNI